MAPCWIGPWLAGGCARVQWRGLRREYFSHKEAQAGETQAMITGTVRMLSAVEKRIAAETRCGAIP